jgi:hypothetical protein
VSAAAGLTNIRALGPEEGAVDTDLAGTFAEQDGDGYGKVSPGGFTAA